MCKVVDNYLIVGAKKMQKKGRSLVRGITINSVALPLNKEFLFL